MESATINRVRLWLRSERAFGLSSVPARASAVVEQEEQEQAELSTTHGAQHPDRALFASVAAPKNMASRAQADSSQARPAQQPAQAFDAPHLSTAEKKSRLIAMDSNEVRGCTKCRLCEKRTNTVFGEGNVDAGIVFIGEGPGENEDLQGRPFVGRAGEMLNKWIAAMGLRREDVYIANIVKCRPPNNREPAPDEVATCTPYLQRQLEIIRPKVIVTLGLPSLKHMTGDAKLAMGRSRGIWREWRGIKLMPTFHPAYILRNYTDETRAAVWSDLKMVMAELGMPVPKR